VSAQLRALLLDAGEKAVSTHCIGGWIGSVTSPDIIQEKEIPSLLPWVENRVVRGNKSFQESDIIFKMEIDLSEE
jgi:hypothetical protein